MNTRNINYYKIIIFSLFLTFSYSCRKSNYIVKDNIITLRDNGSGTGTTNWTSENEYIIEGFVFVNDGQTLTIEAGTVIRGRIGQGSAASALIVARGAKIIAKGNPENPIIFTVEGDDLQGSVPVMSKGLWGGLLILGNARLNLESSESHIEGIPLSEPRGLYGGSDDQDNSGIIQYVSIRHGGTNIGEGNEINGLTLGGVGNGTIIEHVEIISNADDGIEFFGGCVNCKNIVVAFCGDDAFDYDLGYSGKGQFWLAIQDLASGDLLVEAGGGEDPVEGEPYSIPEIYNATFIGRGEEINNSLMSFDFNAGGEFANSIFINQGNGIELEYTPNRMNSFTQFEKANLKIKNNVFFNINNDTPEGIFKVVAESGIDVSEQNAVFQEYFSTAKNIIFDPGIKYEDGSYNIIPFGDVFTNLAPYPSAWFDNVNYKGAFGNYNWADGWTLLSQSGYIN